MGLYRVQKFLRPFDRPVKRASLLAIILSLHTLYFVALPNNSLVGKGYILRSFWKSTRIRWRIGQRVLRCVHRLTGGQIVPE